MPTPTSWYAEANRILLKERKRENTMTTDTDLRRLAEQAVRWGQTLTLTTVQAQAILALLNERDAIEAETNRKWNEAEGTVWHYCGHEDDSHVDAAERRVAAMEEGLRALDEPLQWLNDHYHKAMVEMPTHLFRRFDKARAALAAADASAGGGGSASTEAEE